MTNASSSSRLPKAKRALFRALTAAALVAGAFLLVSRDALPQGSAALRANVGADVAAVDEADGGSESRQLARHWFKDKRPGHRTWRRNKWSFYIKKRRKIGRKIKYVKDRPGWTPHPNKGKRIVEAVKAVENDPLCDKCVSAEAVRQVGCAFSNYEVSGGMSGCYVRGSGIADNENQCLTSLSPNMHEKVVWCEIVPGS